MRSIKAILGERETFTVERQVSVADAARLMAEHHIGAVPVVDAGRLVGIFSERDVLTRVVAACLVPEATPVGEVMSSDLIAAEWHEGYDVCLGRMQQSHVRHLIVLEHADLQKLRS